MCYPVLVGPNICFFSINGNRVVSISGQNKRTNYIPLPITLYSLVLKTFLALTSRKSNLGKGKFHVVDGSISN